MGIQSQKCNGSVKKMKKRGTKLKRKSKHRLSWMKIASNPFCKRCWILDKFPKRTPERKKALRKYKHGHHHLCPQRRANKRKATIQASEDTTRNDIDIAHNNFVTITNPCEDDYLEIARLLSESEADVNAKSNNDWTPANDPAARVAPTNQIQHFDQMLPALLPSPAPVMYTMTQHLPIRNPYGYQNQHGFGNYCFPYYYPFCCLPYKDYCYRKRMGTVKGRPPHKLWCPKTMGLQYSYYH